MKKPMEVSVVPAKEQADRSVYEALAMMIVEFYKRNPEFVEHPERMAEHEPRKLNIGTGSNTCTVSSAGWIGTYPGSLSGGMCAPVCRNKSRKEKQKDGKNRCKG